MTDATRDPLADKTTPADGEGPEYVVTPTLRAFGELVERVEQLEADSPAIGAEDDDEDALTQGRLTRHRRELEEIKETLNALIKFLTIPGVPLPNPIAAAPVAAPASTLEGTQ